MKQPRKTQHERIKAMLCSGREINLTHTPFTAYKLLNYATFRTTNKTA